MPLIAGFAAESSLMIDQDLSVLPSSTMMTSYEYPSRVITDSIQPVSSRRDSSSLNNDITIEISMEAYCSSDLYSANGSFATILRERMVESTVPNTKQ